MRAILGATLWLMMSVAQGAAQSAPPSEEDGEVAADAEPTLRVAVDVEEGPLRNAVALYLEPLAVELRWGEAGAGETSVQVVRGRKTVAFRLEHADRVFERRFPFLRGKSEDAAIDELGLALRSAIEGLLAEGEIGVTRAPPPAPPTPPVALAAPAAAVETSPSAWSLSLGYAPWWTVGELFQGGRLRLSYARDLLRIGAVAEHAPERVTTLGSAIVGLRVSRAAVAAGIERRWEHGSIRAAAVLGVRVLRRRTLDAPERLYAPARLTSFLAAAEGGGSVRMTHHLSLYVDVAVIATVAGRVRLRLETPNGLETLRTEAPVGVMGSAGLKVDLAR